MSYTIKSPQWIKGGCVDWYVPVPDGWVGYVEVDNGWRVIGWIGTEQIVEDMLVSEMEARKVVESRYYQVVEKMVSRWVE